MELIREVLKKDREQREIINFNLLRLSEELNFAFTVEDNRIISNYVFKKNPIAFIRIGHERFYGRYQPFKSFHKIMNEDLIIKLFRYFSRFVPVMVLKALMIQPEHSWLPGYSEIEAEILADPAQRIPEIEKFVFSINEKFVSERIKNAKSFILFVEYGSISADFERANGIKESVAVTVAHNFSDTNNDNLNEVLLMNRCLDILLSILRRMTADQGQLDFCSSIDLITMPVDIQVVDPTTFYGCGGWCALFQNSTTMLV